MQGNKVALRIAMALSFAFLFPYCCAQSMNCFDFNEYLYIVHNISILCSM